MCRKWQAARQALETRLADLAMAKRAVEGEVRRDGDGKGLRSTWKKLDGQMKHLDSWDCHWRSVSVKILLRTQSILLRPFTSNLDMHLSTYFPHLHQIPTCKCQSRPFVVCGLCEFCVFACVCVGWCIARCSDLWHGWPAFLGFLGGQRFRKGIDMHVAKLREKAKAWQQQIEVLDKESSVAT